MLKHRITAYVNVFEEVVNMYLRPHLSIPFNHEIVPYIPWISYCKVNKSVYKLIFMVIVLFTL